jgi:hypothetical protein
MHLRELQRIVHDMAGKSDQAIDQALREMRLDAQDRLAAKLELSAVAQQRTIAARLAADDAEWHPAQPMQPMNEIERLMQRAGLLPGGKYTEADIDEGCRLAGIVDPTQRLAIKVEAEMRGMLTSRQTDRESPRLHAMRASAERPTGTELRDPRSGQPANLQFLP